MMGCTISYMGRGQQCRDGLPRPKSARKAIRISPPSTCTPRADQLWW